MLQVCVEGVSKAEEGLHTGLVMMMTMIVGMMMLTMAMTILMMMTMTVTTMVITLAADQLFALLDPPLLCTGKLPQVLPGNLHRLENRYSFLYSFPLFLWKLKKHANLRRPASQVHFAKIRL